jgi:hypothetical protein
MRRRVELRPSGSHAWRGSGRHVQAKEKQTIGLSPAHLNFTWIGIKGKCRHSDLPISSQRAGRANLCIDETLDRLFRPSSILEGTVA